MHRFPLTVVVSLGLFAAACGDGSHRAAGTSSVTRGDSAGGEVDSAARAGQAATSTTAAAQSRPAPQAAVAPHALGATAATDSAIKLQIATQPKSRTTADSISLVAAIRTGLETPWPVRTPTLLPGSILPARRIVAFYGNPLSKKMGILGEIP